MVLARMELGSGREIKLSELHLKSTYGGLIEGYPMARLNDMKVAGLAEQAGRLLPHAPVHVVEPLRTRPEQDSGTASPFGPLELLPAVICMGRFSSGPINPGFDPVLHYSRLVIVWFQDNATVPAGRDIPAGLRDVRWEDWAQDEEI
ncbi:hypothetical protein ABZS66_57350 [Dactylosporangium sp. NPDC005572]|uniref:hypothetical protein n=1 Tax=Dactylosporangium sp. NPDC005572 TaxID=3156889 RepID=UPI0033ADD4D7